MSEQHESPPNKETQMATSSDEANQENPPETPQQESNPEEEEEEDKKTVRNPRNVALEPDPLAPFLVRLEHDQQTQIGFFKGMINFHRRNKEYPFERKEAMEDFIHNWLQVRVPPLDFQQTLQRVWGRYAETGNAIGENLNALSPADRQVFLSANGILFAYFSEKKAKKRKIQETHGATCSSNKGVKIGASNVPPDKEPEKGLKKYKEVDNKLEPKKGLKQYKEFDKKWKIVVETNKLKLKFVSEYHQKKVEEPREKPEEQKRENPPEEKPSEEDEQEEAWSEANFETLISILQSLADYNFKLSKFPYDDVNDMEEFIKNWVGLDISVSDCVGVIKRLKKNFKKKFWMAIDHGYRFRNQKQEQLYICADVLWNMEAHMNSDDEGDEEEEEEKKDLSDEGGGNLEGESPDDEQFLDFSEPEYDPAMRPLLPFLIRSTFEQGPGIVSDLMPVENPVPLQIIRPPIPPVPRFQDTKKEDNEQQKAGSGKDSSSVKRILPRIIVCRRIPRVEGFQDTEKVDKKQQKVKRTGLQTILRGVPPVLRSQDSKREEMLQRPIPPVPQFQDTKKEDKNQQKADSGEDSSSGNRTDPGGASSQGGDPDSEKPHDENPEGGSEAPEELKSGGDEIKDTKQ